MRVFGVERVWLAFCAALAAGGFCGFRLGAFVSFWPLVFSLAAVLLLFALSRASTAWISVVCAVIGFALALRVCADRLDSFREIAGGERGRHDEVFTVLSDATSRSDGWTSFRTRMGNVPVRVVCRLGPDQELPRAGERWNCSGWLRVGEFDDFLSERTFWATGDGPTAFRVASASPLSPRALASCARRAFSERVGWGLEHDSLAADLNRAILLGEKFRLDRRTKETFAAAGTLHVFAISGLHVMIVARLISILLLLTFLPARFHGLVALPLLWAYVLMVGAPPSAVRAGLMSTFAFLAPLFWRRPNGLIAWSATFLLVHVVDPTMLFDVGSLFSFAVMFSLGLFGRLAEGFRRPFVRALVPACAAWAAGVPIAAHVFGRFTPGGLVANVVMIPIAGVEVSVESLGLLAGFVSRALAEHFNNLSALLTRLMTGVSTFVSEIPGADVALEPWGASTCILWYVMMGLVFFLLSRRLDRPSEL